MVNMDVITLDNYLRRNHRIFYCLIWDPKSFGEMREVKALTVCKYIELRSLWKGLRDRKFQFFINEP